ncbi:MAG: hypothetical protein AAFP81_11350 [Pseudomonadota bacterium]
MFLKTFSALAIAIAWVGSAAADSSYNSCPAGAKPESETCKTLKLFNKAGVTAKSVNVIQQPNEAGCTKDERHYSENLGDEEILRVKVDPRCKYKIRFKTKSSCSGDSTAYMTPSKFADGKNTVFLHGKCSSLKTKVDYYQW